MTRKGKDELRLSRRMKGFERASGLMQSRIRAASEARGFAVARLLTHWDDIVGPEFAKIARPVKVSYSGKGFGATLVVLTTGAQAPMLNMQTEKLRQRVNACYGYNAIERVQITQTAATGFAEARALFEGRSTEKTPAPSDPAARREAQALSATVQDSALREALEDMGRTILSRPQSKGTE